MVETEITKFLDEKDIDYQILEHSEEAYTSEKAAELRDVPLEEMIKTMVFLDDDRDIVTALVPANKKVDLKALRENAKIGSLKFADEDLIESELGFPMGAIPPFFPGRDTRIFMDSEIFWNNKVNFSSGRPDAGIEVDLATFRQLMDKFDAEKAPIGEED